MRSPRYGPVEPPSPGRVAGPFDAVEVEVVEAPWVDELSKPGTWYPHDVGTLLLLTVPVYRTLRRIGEERIARRFVRCAAHGREYLHAVYACRGRLVGVEGHEARYAGRLRVRGSEYAGGGVTHKPERPAVPVVVPGPVAVRAGCGCARGV